MGKNKKININDYLEADETTFMTLSGFQFAMIKDAIRETVNEEWKSKIKEKIKKYNKQREKTDDKEIYYRLVDYIDVLQELLED